MGVKLSSMSDSASGDGGVDCDHVGMLADSAVKRLDHIHDLFTQVSRHAGDGATVDACDAGQQLVEATQADLRELEEAVAAGEERGPQ